MESPRSEPSVVVHRTQSLSQRGQFDHFNGAPAREYERRIDDEHPRRAVLGPVLVFSKIENRNGECIWIDRATRLVVPALNR
jgi:hypothetical protein